MKRSIFIVAAAVAALAVPASATADVNNGTDCSYAKTEEASQTVGPLTVYAGTNDSGMTGTALVSGGACADGLGLPGVDGGAAEAGAGDGGYVIVDGSNQNADPTGQGDGYIGVSNYETGTTGTCSGGGSGSNSGGCFGVDGVPVTAPLPIACGNTSGTTWASTTRDGCSIP